MLEKFVIITGTPGTGKTTVAKLLSKKGWVTFDITSFVKEKSLFLGYDIIRDSLIIDEEQLQKELVKEAEDRKIVILDGHTATLIEDKFVKYCFILKVDLEVLNERLIARNYSELKVSENLQAEIMESCLTEAYDAYDANKIHSIETTNKTPEEVVSIISSILLQRIDQSDPQARQ
ncbi:MAG: AAA family ATPase [Candidatus Kariarchaeaceae archaeon]